MVARWRLQMKCRFQIVASEFRLPELEFSLIKGDFLQLNMKERGRDLSNVNESLRDQEYFVVSIITKA